jgi:hypothetical protein
MTGPNGQSRRWREHQESSIRRLTVTLDYETDAPLPNSSPDEETLMARAYGSSAHLLMKRATTSGRVHRWLDANTPVSPSSAVA